MRRVALAVVVLFVALLAAGRAEAHGMRTGSLRIDEITPTHALARWTTTIPDAVAEPELGGADCTVAPLDDDTVGEGQRVYSLECPRGLAGARVGVRGLGVGVTEATVFVQLRGGLSLSHLLVPDAPTWELPKAQTWLDVARTYVRAGIAHIASGADHLLFLALLVLLLRRVRAVLLAETAFTISHSIAFSATALGWIHVRPAPAEACIALSLVLVALDVRAHADASRSARHGALVAFVFGLVHGLGFAGGLRELGLPDAHAAVALVGFGVGVELGQIAFLALSLAVVALFARARGGRPLARFVPVATTIIGAVSTAWLIERVLLTFSIAV